MNKKTRLFDSARGVPALSRIRVTGQRVHPGELPGIEHIAAISQPPEEGSVGITFIDYCDSQINSGNVTNLQAFLDKPMPDWVSVRWINVSRLHPYVVNQFRQHFEFHTLTAEDVLHIPQRPRVESFDDHLFVVSRMLQLVEHETNNGESGWAMDAEQVSFFLYDKVLITFQEKQQDVWQPIREQLRREKLRIRKHGSGYLLYTLLDAMVDHCFPVLEHYGDMLEELELTTLENPQPEVLRRIHDIKHELSILRRIVWPMREVVDQLYRDESSAIADSTRPYLRDVYEHTIQVVEIIESYREMAIGITDLYMSAVSNRMNEIMKVLTIMASVFIPLTFIAGVYGMNFQFMPELHSRWGYPLVWLSFIALTGGLLVFFRRKGWIGKG